jgi:catechol 2,3-dioxygenase-like lactoylglutathione lyase family enzyme
MTIGASAGVITFINTRDPETARAFYGETLGFRFVVDDGFAHVFDLNGTTLRITKLDNHVAQGHPVLGQDELGIWTAPDGKAKVAFFNDPDGNALSLTSA